MKILLVFDHPYTIAASENIAHRRSFSAAVASAAIRGAAAGGHEVDLIDLAADGFRPGMSATDLAAWRRGVAIDPVVRDYQRRLLSADHLTFVFPVWWEAMPANTKGFLDRVLTKGVAYDEITDKRGNPFVNLLPKLGGVTVLSVMSTPHAAYRWWYGDPLTKILFRGTFGKIGVKNLRWINYDAASTGTPEHRTKMLRKTENTFATLRSAAGTRG